MNVQHCQHYKQPVIKNAWLSAAAFRQKMWQVIHERGVLVGDIGKVRVIVLLTGHITHFPQCEMLKCSVVQFCVFQPFFNRFSPALSSLMSHSVNCTLELTEPTQSRPILRKYFKESPLILVHTTVDRSDNITTVPSEPLWLWFFQYWSAMAAWQRVDRWASHPIGLHQ